MITIGASPSHSNVVVTMMSPMRAPIAYSNTDRNAAAEVANAYHNGEITLVEMIRSIADIHANRSREQGAGK